MKNILVEDIDKKFVEFENIRKITEDKYVLITFSDNTILKCSLNHRIFIDKFKFEFAKNLKINDSIFSNETSKKIIDIKIINEKIDLFDLINVNNKNKSYYTNGIYSHNCFLGSAYTLINAAALTKIKEQVDKDRDVKYNVLQLLDFAVNIIKDPVKGHFYVLGADVGDGVGLDFSTFHVFDITNPVCIEEVAYFSSNLIKTIEYAYVIAKTGLLFNYCPVFCEANSIGRSVIDHLFYTFEYEYLAHIGGKNLGIQSNPTTKKQSVIQFKEIMENNKIEIVFHSKALYDQLCSFGKKGDSYGGLDSSHDDDVMATIWAFYILCEDNMQSFYEAEWKKYTETFIWYTNIHRFESQVQSNANRTQMNIEKEYGKLKSYVETKDKTLLEDVAYNKEDVVHLNAVKFF